MRRIRRPQNVSSRRRGGKSFKKKGKLKIGNSAALLRESHNSYALNISRHSPKKHRSNFGRWLERAKNSVRRKKTKTACLAYHKIFFAFIIASPFAANENPVIQQFSVWYFLLTRQIQRGRGGRGLCVIGSGIEIKELYIIVFPYAFLVCKPAEANANLPQQTKQRMANYFFFAMTKAQYLMNSGLKTGNDQHVREGNLAVQRQSVWTVFLLLLA